LHCSYVLYLITMNSCTSLSSMNLCMRWYNVIAEPN